MVLQIPSAAPPLGSGAFPSPNLVTLQNYLVALCHSVEVYVGVSEKLLGYVRPQKFLPVKFGPSGSKRYDRCWGSKHHPLGM